MQKFDDIPALVANITQIVSILNLKLLPMMMFDFAEFWMRPIQNACRSILFFVSLFVRIKVEVCPNRNWVNTHWNANALFEKQITFFEIGFPNLSHNRVNTRTFPQAYFL